MKTTPAHRADETRSCKKISAARVVMTKLSPVSGQRKLMSLFDISTSRQMKNNASKKTPPKIRNVGDAGFHDAHHFRDVDFLEVAHLFDAGFKQHDARRFEDKSDEENGEQFNHLTNPGIESVECLVQSRILSRAG